MYYYFLATWIWIFHPPICKREECWIFAILKMWSDIGDGTKDDETKIQLQDQILLQSNTHLYQKYHGIAYSFTWVGKWSFWVILIRTKITLINFSNLNLICWEKVHGRIFSALWEMRKGQKWSAFRMSI